MIKKEGERVRERKAHFQKKCPDFVFYVFM